jgi:hypothetical protein
VTRSAFATAGAHAADEGSLRGHAGFWQGAFREPAAPEFVAARAAIEAREPVTIDVLYGDHEGGQRAITRFVLVPGKDGDWIAAAGRHWNLDREDPRQGEAACLNATSSPASPLLVRRPLRRREGFETLVGNGLSALDRETVGAGGKALLGSVDGCELVAEIVLQPFVELVLVEIGCLIRRIELVGRLAVVFAGTMAQRLLDAPAFGQ